MNEQPIITSLTISQLNSIGKPEDAVFRQTVNRETGKWHCPKRRGKDGKWKVIGNRQLIINREYPKNPYKFGIWRLKMVMSMIQHSDHIPVWECYPIQAYDGRPGYTLLYLRCKRRVTSMRGGMM